MYLTKFSVTLLLFHILYKLKNRDQLLQYLSINSTARRSHTTVELPCCETPDFVIAPNMWISNIPGLNPVDYGILAVLQERIYRQSVRDVNVLRRRLIRQLV